jgi:hypothetical protein
MTKLLELDSAAFSAAFGNDPMAVRHSLAEHPLLTVERVAQLADELPAESVEHNLGNVDKFVPGGEAPRLDQTPGQIAREIDSNGCWMELKNIEREPGYNALLDEALDEVTAFADTEGGMTGREGFIFLSAPNSMTPAHIDPEHNFLLQIRSTKVMNAGRFPDAETEQAELERYYRGGHRNIGWEPAESQAFPLGPGDGVYMPPHAPHWVTSGPTVSVSLSVTFRTPVTERAARVNVANAHLRKLKLSPRPAGASDTADKLKAGLARSYEKLRRAG